jgi:hypothetical protein
MKTANEAKREYMPSLPYQKPNGAWTFDVFPGGVRTEFAYYPDQESAYSDAVRTRELWERKGQNYRFLDGFTLPRPKEAARHRKRQNRTRGD